MFKARFIIEAESAGVGTHTGKIKSSRRITKALQVAIESGEPVEYTFDDGTVGTIEPSMAKLALAKYEALSPFEKAQAAEYMRGSFKNYIRAIKGQ
jgi:hypothetical protein